MDTFNPQDIAKLIMEALEKEMKQLEKLNVMILGKTGVGKSTLINNMFNESLADTGIGKPVTQKIRKIEKPDFPLAIYDTPGLELGGEFAIESLIEEVSEEIDKGFHSGDINQAIHCIWYCISTPSHRIEQAEINFLKEFHERAKGYNIPVIVVLTKSYSKSDAKALIKEIEQENLPIVNIVPVLAENFELNEEYTAKAYGLDRLSEVMNNAIPESVQKTFIAVQKSNMKLKRDRARYLVTLSSATAAASAATPIPFSDALVLVPNQVAMLAGITAIFGLPIEKAMLTAIISSTIGTAGTTVLGRSVVANLLKMIPGVGSIAGGLISSSTAAALTAALGEAYIQIMVMIIKGELKVEDLGTKKGKKEISTIFSKMLKKERNEIGEPTLE